MHEYEDERDVQCLYEAACVCEAPREGRQGKEEGEEVRKGRVRTVVGLGCLFLDSVSSCESQARDSVRGSRSV